MVRFSSIVAAGLLACGLGGATLKAQSSGTGTKVAVINVQAAIASTAEGKQAAAQLQTEFTPRRNEIEQMNKKINDIQQRLNASSGVLSDAEKENLTVEGQRLSQQLQRKQTEYQEDLTEAQQEIVTRIGRKLVTVLNKYAPSNGYAAVLDDSSQTTPVMYASTDITEEIIKLYDQTYPVKSAASAGDPKPSASKPATKRPSGR
ncbi:MAG TPA: OmpH family outer membrane protein [Candidatus Acidoferrum sp.]|nr:OmpH family outer membrane protein [Candidatus Acidoferrum sp.]